MEIDWEVEVGGGAPAIDALWTGFVDLRRNPKRIAEIEEAVAFAPLGRLLLTLNSAGARFWTAKCDFWRPDAGEAGMAREEGNGESHGEIAAACYVDILPVEGLVFGAWKQAEEYCRRWVRELQAVAMEHCRVDLVVRQAIAGAAEGFGITAYTGAWGNDEPEAEERLAAALVAFADAIRRAEQAEKGASKLQ